MFDYADKGKLMLYISALSYSNIYYIVKKMCTHKEMIALLRDMEAITVTLDVTKQIIVHSLNAAFKDFEDAIQFCTALSNNRVEAIITRNPRDFKNSDIAVLTPEEALSSIETVDK